MDETLLTQIVQADDELNRLLDRITPEAALQPNTLGWWSAREIVGHITGWQIFGIAMLSALRDGTPVPTYESEDAFNVISVSQREGKTWDELRVELKQTQTWLLELAHSLPPKVWEDKRVPNWLHALTIEHYETHEPDLQRLIAATA